MNKEWILSDEDFDFFMQSEGEWFDWLIDNGIFNENASRYWFMCMRYDQYSDGSWKGVCPHCLENCDITQLKGSSGERNLLSCKGCRSSFSITTKTWMEHTKLGLVYWRRLAWLLGKGMSINSIWLAKEFDITQKTAYWMLCKFATATNNPIRTPLQIKLSAYEIEKLLLQPPHTVINEEDLKEQTLRVA